MARYSATIRTFLLSHMTNDFDEPNGQGVKNDGLKGDFYHYNEVIDKTHNRIFEKMNFHPVVGSAIDNNFEREFCKRFYNMEIGYEVFAQFFIALENTFNTTCFNFFKFRLELMQMSLEDSRLTMDVSSTANGDSRNLALTATTPQEDLSIIYPGNAGDVIKYADAIGENYGKNTGESTTKGSNTRPLFELLNYHAQLTPIDEQIFNIVEQRCFMQIF